MKRTLLTAFLLLWLCFLLVLGLERYDQARHAEQRAQTVAQQMQPHAERLQSKLDALVRDNRALAQRLQGLPQWTGPAVQAMAAEVLQRQPRVRSVVLSRPLKVVFVYPTAGNETIMGLDYGLAPEFMGSINRAMATRDTSIDAPVRLRQNWRSGFIVRTPVFEGDVFIGQVTMAIDLDALLSEAGLLAPDLPFSPVLVRRLQGGAPLLVYGSEEALARAATGVAIRLPDGPWELRAESKLDGDQVALRAGWIRGTGAVLALGLLCWVLYRGGLLGRNTSARMVNGIGLRSVMLLFVFIPSMLLVLGTGWLTYRVGSDVAQRMEQQQANELMEVVRARVNAFFDVPRQVDTFTAELFRQGVLSPQRPEEMMTVFLAQFRQQPQLSFLSMGNAQGEYFAASRPPLGDDKTLRTLWATVADGRVMRVARVDDANRISGPAQVANRYFDARERAWFQAAVAANSLKWYEPYRYGVNDPEGRYDTLGMGMSAPLYDNQQRFLGVVTADVALSQLSDFLRAELAPFDGLGFMAQADGYLLATSVGEALDRQVNQQTQRLRVGQSSSASIRAAGAAIEALGTPSGQHRIETDGQRYWLQWQAVQLPDGPSLTLALLLPETRFSAPAMQVFRDMALLILGLLVLGWVTALIFAHWFTQPLLQLEQWARRLGAREWTAPPPPAHPIREITSLTASLDTMSAQLQRNTQELEHRVTERTEALEMANRRLAELSSTDGLTGLANRRRFDEVVAAEWARSKRSGQPLALLLLDVDQFKPYNDNYGHPAGDEVLKRVAQVLGESARRPTDLAARYGGEEFVLVAAETGPEEALALAERIRSGIAALALKHDHGSSGVVTVSVGVAAVRAGAGADMQVLLESADAALYAAKRAGRNRCVLAGHPPDAQVLRGV
jgi:diguanylate cyclase (GGDEF)-like protein